MYAKLAILTTVMALSLMGCAHGLMRGSVAMKMNDKEAHVCMGRGEVKIGDRVTTYSNYCPGKGGGGRSGGGGGGICQKIKKGEGTVTQILNEHYSVVTFDQGVEFDEGSFVEKF